LRNRYSASEVLGALLIAAVVIAASIVYTTMAAERVGSEAIGVMDALRVAEQKQSQLLSLTYYYKDGAYLKLYIYNYGSVSSAPKGVYVNGVEQSFTMKDMNSGRSCREIAPKMLVELSVRAYGSNPYEILLLTEEGATYIWKLVV
jgi:hypothetical protein